jgi:multicomponent Na+:H+ antiporter subunit D
MDYVPYTSSHVLQQLQLLFFSALAFTVLKLTHVYPPELRSTNLDVDWTFRRLAPAIVSAIGSVCASVRDAVIDSGKQVVAQCIGYARVHHGPGGVFARTWLTSSAVLLIVTMLAAYLLFAYRAGL